MKSTSWNKKLSDIKKYILTKDLIEVRRIGENGYIFMYTDGSLLKASGPLLDDSIIPEGVLQKKMNKFIF